MSANGTHEFVWLRMLSRQIFVTKNQVLSMGIVQPSADIYYSRLTKGVPETRLTHMIAISTFVLMEVETLGMARSLGWKVHMRCAHGYREGTRSMRRCVYRKQLELETLVCTCGPNFPLSRLEARLMCPVCGSRMVTVVFEPPRNCGAQVGTS